jgi:hypothetical protein
MAALQEAEAADRKMLKTYVELMILFPNCCPPDYRRLLKKSKSGVAYSDLSAFGACCFGLYRNVAFVGVLASRSALIFFSAAHRASFASGV